MPSRRKCSARLADAKTRMYGAQDADTEPSPTEILAEHGHIIGTLHAMHYVQDALSQVRDFLDEI